MRCPKCTSVEDKVIDSRLSRDGLTIRRRRECFSCATRFTTYEQIERIEMHVIKRDGRRESFDRQKLFSSVQKACEKRPIPTEILQGTVEDLIHEFEGLPEREIRSRHIGAKVMERLRALDPVAYVRYASVYRRFEEVGDFIEEIQSLKRHTEQLPNHPELFENP